MKSYRTQYETALALALEVHRTTPIKTGEGIIPIKEAIKLSATCRQHNAQIVALLYSASNAHEALLDTVYEMFDTDVFHPLSLLTQKTSQSYPEYIRRLAWNSTARETMVRICERKVETITDATKQIDSPEWRALRFLRAWVRKDVETHVGNYLL